VFKNHLKEQNNIGGEIRMKKNKGFTLIELLAVIVILAIIALIAVPVILNIIDKSNKSAFKDTAYGIISAGELYFAEKQLDLNGMETEKTFNLPGDANVEGGIEIKGTVPTGTLKVNTEGKTSLAVSNGRYCITKGYDDTDITITEDLEQCGVSNDEDNVTDNTGSTGEKTLSELATTSTELVVTSVDACAISGTCEVGTAFAIKVNEEETYKFYVIADDGEKVTLIMDRNLGDRVAWVSKTDYNDDTNYGTYGNNNKGPTTVLNYLNSQINSQTSTWDNIDPIEEYTYDNNLNGTTNTYGYQKLTITNGVGILTSQDGTIETELEGTMRARLLTYEEASTLKTNNNETMPTWLYENLSISNTTDAPFGYWVLTAFPSDSSYGRAMNCFGFSFNNVAYETHFGARPVIELTK